MAAADYIIVGSGINGLTCAALLGKKGRRVLVLDKAGGTRYGEPGLPAVWQGVLGILLARDTLLPQLLAAMARRRCLGIGNSSNCNNTLSNRSGNDRRKNRDAGVVPSAVRQSKLCNTVHT